MGDSISITGASADKMRITLKHNQDNRITFWTTTPTNEGCIFSAYICRTTLVVYIA